jgi:hypothetical protein
MELLVLILNRPELFEKALSALRKARIREITVYDSESLGQFLSETEEESHRIPEPVGMRRSACKTVTALLSDTTSFEDIKSALLRKGIDVTQPGEGMMLTVPVIKVA